MAVIFSQVAKYVLLVLMALFTIETYMVLRRRDAESRNRIMRKQIGLMVLFNITCYSVMFVNTEDYWMLMMLVCMIFYIIVVQVLYRLIYKRASMILLNTMCMMLSIGMVIQSRLDMDTARKQFVIAAGATMVCFIIPVFIRRVRWVSRLTWVYAVVGILLLGAVLLFGKISGGANLSVSIGGVSFAFSEFVKITFVLFVAGMLQERHDLRQVIIVTIVAAIHVGILALSADLGAALIYFVAWIVMVIVATRQPGYAVIGVGGMAGACVVAYHLFEHVRTRVEIWKDPLSDYEGSGYQLAQALFGICAGGWFGTGLCQGNPESIPLASEDFTFAAICEEFGILFAICLILLCMCMYLLIINIALRLEKPFYKLVAMGLGTEYAFQVFLTVGGTTKFIPMTGITLPLISYGGSSMVCTIMMISIIQGLYIMRSDEDKEIRREKKRRRQEEYLRQLRQAQYQNNYQNGYQNGSQNGYPGGSQNPYRNQNMYSGQNAYSSQNVYGNQNAYSNQNEQNSLQNGDTEIYVKKKSRHVTSTYDMGGKDDGQKDNYMDQVSEQSGDDNELSEKIEQQTREDLAFRNH
ncbi:MAG: FtsW/RodA/SpoVE family cell cycle protein [Eubacteriales bacterium]|jgi:cell division protein FtsW (lipid II flippase)